MLRSLRQLGMVLAVAVCVPAAVCAQASLGGAIGCFAEEALANSPELGVHDRAALFQLDTVAKARDAIQRFRREYHRDIFIETYPHVPLADRKHVRFLSHAHLDQYFGSWAKIRAKAIGVDGVYMLICTEPKNVYVLVNPNTPEQGFSDDNVQELRKRLRRQLATSRDSALPDAIYFVENTIEENLSERAAASSSISFETVAAILAGLVGFWLLLSLARVILQGRGSSGGDPAHVGLIAGFFAALFGTTAGHWIYDRVFHAHAPATPAPDSDYLVASRPPASAPAESTEPHDRESPTAWPHD